MIFYKIGRFCWNTISFTRFPVGSVMEGYIDTFPSCKVLLMHSGLISEKVQFWKDLKYWPFVTKISKTASSSSQFLALYIWKWNCQEVLYLAQFYFNIFRFVRALLSCKSLFWLCEESICLTCLVCFTKFLSLQYILMAVNATFWEH